MAKIPSSAIGIDVGRHAMKAVILQRNAKRLALTHFAVREFPEEANTLEALGENLKALLRDLGGSAKAAGITVSHPDTMVRIIEQNTIPPELLREALRLNGPMLLSQDCRDWVLDCHAIEPSHKKSDAAESGGAGTARYLVGGLPRPHVRKIYDACIANKLPGTVLQLASAALLNAFEFSNNHVFQKQAFVLVDIGHRQSTVIVAVKGELILVRSVEYGGANFVEQLILQGASSFEEIVALLGQEEVLMVENARLSLNELARSISSSIGFFEAQREEAVSHVYFSGGMTRLASLLNIFTEELHLPCEAWDPFSDCDLMLPKTRLGQLSTQKALLGAAFGVAAEILKGK